MKNWRVRSADPDEPLEPISAEDIAWRIGATSIRPVRPDEAIDDAADTSPDSDPLALTAAPGPKSAPKPVAGRLTAAQAAAAELAALHGSDAEAIAPEWIAEAKSDQAAGAKSRAAVATPVVAKTRKGTSPGSNRTASGAAARPGSRPARRRARLWRDASAVLFAGVGVILIVQLAIGNSGLVAVATGTPGLSPAPSDVAIVATPGPTASPAPTIGPILDPSLIPVIEATPTPIPIITLPPATPRPTPRPTLRPTPRPTVTPTAAPAVAVISSPAGTKSVCAGVVVTFTASSSPGATYSWAADDGFSGSGQSVFHSFALRAQPYQMALTVVGAGGDKAYDSVAINVTC